MRRTAKAIQEALAKGHPVLPIGKPGTGQVMDTKDALGGLGLNPLHLFLADMEELHAPRWERIRDADSFILDEADKANGEVQDEVRHFLALTSRPTVVIVHDGAALPEDFRNLCTVLRQEGT